jgi:hypothetical protein
MFLVISKIGFNEISRFVLMFVLVFSITDAFGAKYYFSTSNGDDSYSGTQAQTPGTPWHSLEKLNALFPSLKAGDSILLKRGDIFYGQIKISASGSLAKPITITAYGKGPKPEICGLTVLNQWRLFKPNIWVSSIELNLKDQINLLTINHVAVPMGRFPQRKFLIYHSDKSKGVIEAQSSGDTINWTGAELVIKKDRWTFDRSKILKKTGSIYKFDQQSDYRTKDGFGYFIQNDIRTLKRDSDWFYDAVNHRVFIYFKTGPLKYRIMAASQENLIYLRDIKNITITDLSLKGSVHNLIDAQGVSNITIRHCIITLAGQDGVYGRFVKALKFESNLVKEINNNGLFIETGADSCLVINNIFTNIGLNLGMGNGQHYESLTGISIAENDGRIYYNLVRGNRLRNIGYNGISGVAAGVIRDNYVSDFCIVKDDGAGIYPGPGSGARKTQVLNNTVINGRTALEGTPYNVNATWGIYVDDNGHDIEISQNCVSEMPSSGIFLHNAYNVQVINNRLQNNQEAQISLSHDVPSDHELTNIIVKNNLFGFYHGQLAVRFYTITTFSNIGIIDYNTYLAAAENSKPFFVKSKSGSKKFMDFPNYKAELSLDRHSIYKKVDSLP